MSDSVNIDDKISQKEEQVEEDEKDETSRNGSSREFIIRVGTLIVLRNDLHEELE